MKYSIVGHIMPAGSLFGALVFVLVLLHEPYQVGGALRKCTSIYVYCEATDECELSSLCDSIHCPDVWETACDGGATCYSYFDKCDNVRTCRDGADELPCDKECGYSEKSCDNGKRCYSSYQKCDGRNYCKDGADESNCPMHYCSLYTCNDNKGCYGYSEKCNGVRDCSDGSDENHCSSSENTLEDKVGFSVAGIVGIVIGLVILTVCLIFCKYYCGKSGGSPRPTNTAAYFVPQTTAHHSTAMMPENQPFQTTHHYNTGQPPTDSDSSYFRPQYPIHNTGQAPTDSNTPYPGSHYPGYAVGGYHPVAQHSAPSVNTHGVSIPQPGTAHPQPSAPLMHQPIPPLTETTAPPPSYDSLYSGDK